MAHPLTLPALGATLIAAAAFGIHVGESAIADINPLYFQGPAIHPRDRGAAIDEVPLETPRPSFADAYGWEEGEAARAAECVGCSEAYVQPAYAAASGWAQTEGYRREAAYQSAGAYAAVEFEAVEPAMQPERANIERYAYYPIEEKPSESEPAFAEAEVEVEYYSE